MLELADGSSFDYLEGQAKRALSEIGTDLLPKLSGCAIFLVKRELEPLVLCLFSFVGAFNFAG